MNENPFKRAVAQASNVTFELHTLGWEAFQNLCGHVAREILGQTVTAFSPSNDAGQDGAFQGEWKRTKTETYVGRFIIQCKFTARRDEHITLSDLQDDLLKAEKLAEKGFARTYLLITNARVSGEADKNIREGFLKVKGIDFFDAFGVEWITQQILASKRLRAFVPRVYGLGDLSQIIDERVYGQTDEILRSWKDNLAKFVPTEPHQRSVHALLNEGFVLLLGDPMAGKSTIAASLALAAADQWGSRPIFISHPDDFKGHWNPDEPKQMFWMDDAFGQTQLDASLTHAWNREFPRLASAIKMGARALFTSRTYVYNAAKGQLKESSFPLLQKSQVVIEVEKLTILEKERILYNHLRLGGQPQEFRRQIKYFLPAIAANEKFFPEVARRLGDPFFTKHLSIGEDSLKRFVEEPKEFLVDIVKQLDRKNFAAASLFFMRAGRVAIPLTLEPHETAAMELLGASLADLREAFVALDGSLVSQALESGERFWKFRHPSIRDAMGTLIAERPDLLDIYLGGVKLNELLTEVVCGAIQLEGAKVRVPASRFSEVISKLETKHMDEVTLGWRFISFLASRCSSDFLKQWMQSRFEDFEKLYERSYIGDYSFCLFLSKLQTANCLPEEFRTAFVSQASDVASNSGEAMFLSSQFANLLSEDERGKAIVRIADKFLPNVRSTIEDLRCNFDLEGDADDHFQDLCSNLEKIQSAAEDDKIYSECGRLLDSIQEAVKDCEDRQKEHEEEQRQEKLRKQMHEEPPDDMGNILDQEARFSKTSTPPPSEKLQSDTEAAAGPRSLFDDVDA